MGKLIYGAHGDEIEFEDRVLAHLQMVILSKLRRNEQFALTSDTSTAAGGGHSTLWFHPSIPLRFVYYGGRHPQLNRGWVEAMMQTANSVQGLRVVAEPEPVT